MERVKISGCENYLQQAWDEPSMGCSDSLVASGDILEIVVIAVISILQALYFLMQG